MVQTLGDTRRLAAGLTGKGFCTGNASVTITLDRHGHLMPGNGEEAAGLLDSYLERTGSG